MKKNIDPCPPGLFDRIIDAIKQEQELRRSRRLLFLCVSLLGISLSSWPFTLTFFLSRWQESGIFYFISSAVENSTVFMAHWREFTMSIFEVLPIVAIVTLLINAIVALFAVKLFFHRDGLLIKYIKNHVMIRHE